MYYIYSQHVASMFAQVKPDLMTGGPAHTEPKVPLCTATQWHGSRLTLSLISCGRPVIGKGAVKNGTIRGANVSYK